MRQLWPPADGDDHVDAYDAARPADPSAPVVRLNFVVSADGSATDEEGRSGGLGGEGDRRLFHALRACADAILVGAGTARSEGYGPHRVPDRLVDRRREDGRDAPAAVVVVSRSLDLDPATDLFTAARTPTVVLTCASAPGDRRRAVERVGRVLVAGDDRVDLTLGLALLREHGLAHVLCEGGPRLAGDLLGAGLVDELCLTLAPALVGEGPPFTGGLGRRADLDLHRVYAEGSELYLRYRVRPL